MTKLKAFLRDVLAAISQTFFFHDARVGLAALGALAVFAPVLAASGFFVAAAAHLLASRVYVGRNLVDGGAIALNGWFAGLATGAFFLTGPTLAIAVAGAVPLTIVATVVCERLLSPWQLPLLVAPYIPAFTLLWVALSGLPWIEVVPPVTFAPSTSIWELVGLGGLRSIGVIFFGQDARLGLALLLIITIKNPKLGPVMLLAAVGSELIAAGLQMPRWQIEQGLHGFTPALVAAACAVRFKGMRWTAVAISVVATPFVELAVIQICGKLGIFGLSISYLVIVWALLLLHPIQRKSAVAQAWGKLQPGPPSRAAAPPVLH